LIIFLQVIIENVGDVFETQRVLLCTAKSTLLVRLANLLTTMHIMIAAVVILSLTTMVYVVCRPIRSCYYSQRKLSLLMTK